MDSDEEMGLKSVSTGDSDQAVRVSCRFLFSLLSSVTDLLIELVTYSNLIPRVLFFPPLGAPEGRGWGGENNYSVQTSRPGLIYYSFLRDAVLL